MAVDPGPHDLTGTPVVLTPSGDAHPRVRTPTFFEDLEEFGDFGGHVLVMRFDFDEDWPTWEMHPQGDELVYLISGSTDVLLRDSDGERRLRVDQPGAYVMIPKGVWHTARPHEPTAMLFVTPGAGTLNEVEPPD